MIDFSKKPLFLAPLAGFSDLPLRSVVKRFGCDVTISEMISANALVYDSAKSVEMLQKSPEEIPYIVQIAGNDVENIKKAVLIINKFDGIDGIDLNCGCPVPKVVRQSAGSALLKDLEQLKRILETIKNVSNKKMLSAKIRLGFDEKNQVLIAKACESSGVDYLAVHGRTRAGGYSASVDYEAILSVKQSVKIPVIANGDIDAKNANDVLKITKADALMIGRASIGKPWIFSEIKSGTSVTAQLKQEIILAHFDAMLKHYGLQGAYIFRKHLHQYSKGMSEASAFRDEINRIENVDLMRDKIENFFA
ncbi:tRNA dihydrouridine synthase [Campylobacter mucosalis]|uniref:tRNA-dihydrouridine synthase n=1 Tax=Campylobacter mucosalis CCUG 21559 TaxID=1032067 RepID=A0A6G5QF46_9BACT|nr:tRNA-dihydrouridine synthase [Campylobacter mucosalis]KEA46019.1 tRNA-dihydrouridine synthase [Campylobacter mucosalis]QCD44244.1 tRNA-dihydrouridine synthase B [Campylobacter mucosalis CCUG 21559]QKF63560.1 tRNA-dihydrouridine synthase B [Campylobacter mucosalis]